MTPTDSSSSAAENPIYNSGQHSNADDLLLEDALSSPVLKGLWCSMDVSKLLVALTAPLLSTSGTNCASTGVSGEVQGIDVSASRASVVGPREQQGRWQHQTSTDSPLSSERFTVDPKAAFGGSDGDTVPPVVGRNECGNSSVCDDAAISTSGATAAGGRAVYSGSGRNLLDIPRAFASPRLPQGGAVLPQQGVAEAHQIARRRRDSRRETEDDPECAIAQKIHGDKASKRSFIDVAGRSTQQGGGAHPCVSLASAPGRETATTQKPKIPRGETFSVAETKSGRNVCGARFEDAQSQNRPQLLYHDTATRENREEKQNREKMPPSVSSGVCTPQQSLRHGEPVCERQPPASHDVNEDAQQNIIRREKEHLQQRTQMRQKDGKENRGCALLQVKRGGAAGMEDGCERRATGPAALGGPGDMEHFDGHAGKRKVEGFSDKQGNASAASSSLYLEGQVLLDKLAQLRLAKCQSDDSTGSPSKRTSFEDAVESACGTGKNINGVKAHQALQQRTLEELKQTLLEQISAKEEVNGRIEDELKKSVTAVLAAALRGRDTNTGRDACPTVYASSTGLGQPGADCFSTSLLDTAASSQSQSPLNLQKDEAPESTAGDNTNITVSSSTCSAPPSNKSDDSDSLFSVPLGSTASERAASASPAKSNSSLSFSSSSALDRCTTVHTGASSDRKGADCSHSASGNRSDPDGGDARSTNSAPCTRSAQKKNSALDERSSESGSTRGQDSPSAVTSGPVHTRTRPASGGSSSRSTTSDVSPAADIVNDFSNDTASSINSSTTGSGVTASTLLPSKSASATPNVCSATQDDTSSSTLADWTSAIVGAAVLEDCVQSVMDLEQHAARVLLLSPPQAAGGAVNQGLLPSLLLQKPPLGGDAGQGTTCRSWRGFSGEKEEPQSTTHIAEKVAAETMTAEKMAAFTAASTLGLYPSGLGDSAVGGVTKDLTGALMLPSLPQGEFDATAGAAHAYRLLQQQLAANAAALSTGGGADILGGGPLPSDSLVTAGNAGVNAPAGTLEPSLPQVWMLQQQHSSSSSSSSGMGASLSPTAPCSFQQPSTVPPAYPWPPAAPPASNIAAVSRGPVASAVAAAALLPRSFRSRSDYLSLCSLQGCSATHENERKPRTLEELRQLPSEEHISLQEMHLLAESLVQDFMKLHHHSARSFYNSTRSSRSAGRAGSLRGSGRKKGQQQDRLEGGRSGAAGGLPNLVLHYRRDNLSFSVTPASAFTPYPPSVFENESSTKDRSLTGGNTDAGSTTLKGSNTNRSSHTYTSSKTYAGTNAGTSISSKMGCISHGSSMEYEMGEEETKETLLGGTRFSTTSSSSSDPPNVSDNSSSSCSSSSFSGGPSERRSSRNSSSISSSSSSSGSSSSCSDGRLERSCSGDNRGEAASRGKWKHARISSGPAGRDGDDDEDDNYAPPLATTHFFKARCQQAGTDTGISDSTVGAVERAFADASTSFLREVYRQSGVGFHSGKSEEKEEEVEEEKKKRNLRPYDWSG